MRIGDLARKAGLNPSAIRYYESVGLMPPPQRQGRRRIYGDEALDRLTFVQFARRLGFTVSEIAALAAASQSRRPFSMQMRNMAARKIEELDRWMEGAHGVRALLTDSLRCHCPDLAACGRGLRTDRQAFRRK